MATSQAEAKPQKRRSVFLRKMQAMLRRDPLRDLMVPLACSDDGIFLTEDGHLGAVFACPPLSGADEGVIARLMGALTNEMPPGTVVQFSYICSPDIEVAVGLYEGARREAIINREIPDNLAAMVERRAQLFRDGVKTAPIKGFDCLISNGVVVITLKFPIGGAMYRDEELFTVREKVGQITEGLKITGFQLTQLSAHDYVMLMRRLLNMNADEIPAAFSEARPLKEQVVGAGDYLRTSGDAIELNGNDIRVLSVKMRPDYTSLAQFAQLPGDPQGGPSQFNVPFMLTTTLVFPDRISTVAKVKTNAAAINYQAFGPMMRWSNLLAYKKEGHDTIVADLDQGGTPVQVATSIVLFGKEGEETVTNKQIGMVKSHFNMFEYVMATEKFISLPVFLNQLPLFASAETMRGLDRTDTMGVTHAVHMLPIVGDWRGTGTGGAMMLLSRRNQPIMFDFYDCPQSRNGVLVGQTGGGKSVTVQQIITDYLSLGGGTRVWVVDVGYSYFKLCKYLGGEFIELSQDSGICLNPFTNVQDLDDELDYLKGILAVMINPDGLPAYEMARVEEAIKATYGRLGNSMTVTDVAEFLLGQGDARLRDMGNMLYPFTRSGQYGRWFDGENNLRMERRFVVLELAQLKTRKHLQKVVLFMLMNRIQYDMYLSGEGNKKLLIIDEAADLLLEGEIGSMVGAFFRKIRKEGGAALVCLQGLSSLYESSAGRSIHENAPVKIILSQSASAVNALEGEDQLGIDSYGYHCMRTLQMVKGKYSEMLLITPLGYGVARLVLDRRALVIYSTSDAERFEVMNRMRGGEDPKQVIESFIERSV